MSHQQMPEALLAESFSRITREGSSTADNLQQLDRSGIPCLPGTRYRLPGTGYPQGVVDAGHSGCSRAIFVGFPWRLVVVLQIFVFDFVVAFLLGLRLFSGLIAFRLFCVFAVFLFVCSFVFLVLLLMFCVMCS